MADDRPVKVHCTEEMRAHMEFAMRRYLAECQEWKMRASRNRHAVTNIDQEIERSRLCLEELTQAGT